MWSWKQSALLPAPLLLLATTYLCYQSLNAVLERGALLNSYKWGQLAPDGVNPFVKAVRE
jgi:hypothetical protein